MIFKKIGIILILFALFCLAIGAVNASSAIFSGHDMSMMPGETKSFELIVKDSNGNLLSDQMVLFELQGTTQNDIAITKSDGKAVFSVKAPWNTGTYRLSYSLFGLSSHSGSGSNKIVVGQPLAQQNIPSETKQDSNTVVIGRSQAYFYGSDITLSIGEARDFKLIVKDSGGKLLANQNVIFSLQGTQTDKIIDYSRNKPQTDVVTTNSNGVAMFKIKPLDQGKYTLSYSLTGISTHSGSGSNKISVNPNSRFISYGPNGSIITIEKVFHKNIKKYRGTEEVFFKKKNKNLVSVKRGSLSLVYFKKTHIIYKKYKVYDNYRQYKEYKVISNNGLKKREYIGLKNEIKSVTRKYVGLKTYR